MNRFVIETTHGRNDPWLKRSLVEKKNQDSFQPGVVSTTDRIIQGYFEPCISSSMDRFDQGSFHTGIVSTRGRFIQGSFRPGVVSTMDRFDQGSLHPGVVSISGRFDQGSFRPVSMFEAITLSKRLLAEAIPCRSGPWSKRSLVVSAIYRFDQWYFHPGIVSNMGGINNKYIQKRIFLTMNRFIHGSFRPWVVSTMDRFSHVLFRHSPFRPWIASSSCRFDQWSIQPVIASSMGRFDQGSIRPGVVPTRFFLKMDRFSKGSFRPWFV